MRCSVRMTLSAWMWQIYTVLPVWKSLKQWVRMWGVLIRSHQTNRSFNRAPRDPQLIVYYWGQSDEAAAADISFSLPRSLSLYATSLISLSFLRSLPLLLLFVLPISEGLSPRGKEGVIWSLRALIKTSVWLSGISCADVCVSVYFSVVLWLHSNLSPFSASLSCTVPAFCSRCLTHSVFVFLRASMKHPAKTSECFGPSFCY